MDQFTAHLDRGWDLVARGDLAGALLSAQKSVELEPESPEAHNLLAHVLAAEGNAEQAVEHYRQAIELDETFIEAMLNAAEVLLHPLGDTEEAAKLIEDALEYCETDDEIADATLLKVDVLLHAGDRDGARKALRSLPDGPFENAQLELAIGRTLFDVSDFEAAEPRLKSAVERDPDNSEGHYFLGLVLEQKGDFRGATVAFLEARELDLAVEPPPWTLPPEEFESRVQQAIRKLSAEAAAPLDGALVIAADAPGIEIVADGVDPRIEVLFDGLDQEKEPRRVARVFVYQRNIERLASGPSAVDQEILRGVERELFVHFPKLVEPPKVEAEGEAEPKGSTDGEH